MKFVKLSGDVFGFGNGGVNRFEVIEKHGDERIKYNTVLFVGNTKIGTVKETVEEVLVKLNDSTVEVK